MIQDVVLQCSVCDIRYVWSIEEQRGGKARPERCPMCERLAPPPGMQRGVVKWYNRGKGFGFITRSDGPEIFVHKSGLARSQSAPCPGQLVQYIVTHGKRGMQAEGVQVLETGEDLLPANDAGSDGRSGG